MESIKSNYYKTIIQYDGTDYFGFQWQKDIPSVQNDFNLSLAKIISGKFTTMSASRTDTGVHALDQVVKITSEEQINLSTFVSELNQHLPSSIRVLKIEETDLAFRPNVSSKSKEYRYLFTNKLKMSPTEMRFVVNNPFKLNIPLMKECASLIIGKHDFINFCSAGSNVKTSVREIYSCELSEVNPHSVLNNPILFPLPQKLVSCYQLRIIGNGFLKQMVRHLMASLWLVGMGKLSKDEFLALLNGGPKPQRLWKVAGPRGLYLYRIEYET